MISTVQMIAPLGQTFLINAGATANTAVVTGYSSSVNYILVENLDTNNDVFVNWSINGQPVSVVLPTAGTPQPGVGIQNGQGRIIALNTGTGFVANANIAVIAFSGTPQVLITSVV